MSRFHLSQLKTSTLTKHLPAASAIGTPFFITFLNNSNYTTLRRRSDIIFPVSRRQFIHTATTSSPSQRYLPVYERQDKVEDLEKYRLGGYHPIQLGDKISDARYLVIHKLGYGNYSTVWLARDRMENRYVSLKIIAARQSRVSSEIRIRNRLRGGDLRHLGRPFVLSTLDEFYIDGPNGRHQCLVSEVAGPTILDVKEKSKNGLLPIETAQRIIAQLAVGLAYIHSCDIVHGGLHTQNVASQLPQFDSWAVTKIYEKVGEPKKTPILRIDQQPLGPEAPPYAVQPASFWSMSAKKLTKDIKIIGFSDAHSIQKEQKALRLPIQYRAPESFFREAVGLPADIWAFGCVVFEIFGSNRLFDGFMPRKDTLLRDMIELLGPFPSRWWQKWENRDQYFLNENTPKINVSEFNSEKKQKPLALRIREMRSGGGQSPGALRSFEPEELIGLQDLLSATLSYLPSERPTAEHISKFGSIQEQIRERFPKLTN